MASFIIMSDDVMEDPRSKDEEVGVEAGKPNHKISGLIDFDLKNDGETEEMKAHVGQADLRLTATDGASREINGVDGPSHGTEDYAIPTDPMQSPRSEFGNSSIGMSSKDKVVPSVGRSSSISLHGEASTSVSLSDSTSVQREIVENATRDDVDKIAVCEPCEVEHDAAHTNVNSLETEDPDLLDSKHNSLVKDDDDEHQPDTSTTECDSSQPPRTSIPLQDSMGAQILLSRFSSWRKKANEAVVQNVQAFSQTDLAHQLKTRAEEVKTRAEVAFRNTKVDPSEEKIPPTEAPLTTMDGGILSPQQEASIDSSTNAHDVTKSQGGATVAMAAPSNEDEFGTSSNDSSVESSSSTEDDSEDDKKYSGASDASMRAATAALYVRSAASVITDSVSSGFRGRYGEESATTPPQKAKPSQTSKILSSRAAEHMQAIIDTLDDSHEYVMLLGQGMLGVNLRQTYLKNRGVYVDFLVDGGAAFNSHVIYTGDVIQKVGNISVAKGTILNVPKMIANAKRPVVLVFSTGLKVEMSKVTYIDVAIAMMHQIKDSESKRGILRMPLTEHETDPEDDTITGVASIDVSSSVAINERSDGELHGGESVMHPVKEMSTEGWTIPPHQLDSINPANVPHPPRAAMEALVSHLAKRGNEAFEFQMMTKAAATTGMDNFRGALRLAFIICALDGRRLPFLSRHFATINPADEGDVEHRQDEDIQRTNASVELMLFLELTAFVELYGATPKSRRLDIAKRIAFKFFLSSKIGSSVEKPMFDFSHLVEEKELTRLRDELVDAGPNGQPPQIHRGTFLPFQDAVVERLHRSPFISFLISDECARMRGYLRDTAPYRTVSAGDIFNHAVNVEDDGNSVNHLLFHVVYLLCQRERETCGENGEIVGEKSDRVIGAAGGLCFATFVKKRLFKIVDVADLALEKEEPLTSQVFIELKKAYEQLWEVFLSPLGGALEVLSNSNEAENELANVRKLLRTAAAEGNLRESLRLLTHSTMTIALSNLVDNLVYDYSVNDYAKFREHQFHEWMCAEISRASAEISCDTRIPRLSHGCIARLLRRAELPNGISSHKPPKQSSDVAEASKVEGGAKMKPSDQLEIPKSTESPLIAKAYPTAHYAIIYGTDEGDGVIDRGTNPTLSQFDVRRYTCQKVVLDFEGCVHPTTLCRVPPTIESYVILPLPRKSHFSQLQHAGRLSADGWFVSLVEFMIPGSEAESSLEGATYGVSLLLQQDESVFINMNQTTEPGFKPLKLFFEEPSTKPEEDSSIHKPGRSDDSIEIPTFSSPITAIEPEAHSGLPLSPVTNAFRVAIDTPSFNRRLAEISWLERVKMRRTAIPTRSPVSIGVILLSSVNSIYAMRESLANLISDFSSASGGGKTEDTLSCRSLIEVLGNYAHFDVEHESLCSLLEPYLRFGSSPWLRQPFRQQHEEFVIDSGQRLLESLPLVPLALLYLTVLLEQKVVFSSSRRCILLSAVTAITKLLHPFKWEHLVVPLVPSTLARDLLEYPAPFIIGLSADDQESMELLNSLPDDVTLVDLDVGRVILAPTIAFGEEPSTSDFSPNPRSKTIALRSQVLYLAQELGIVFGSRLRRQAWCGDSPQICVSRHCDNAVTASFIDLQAICKSFLTELVAGTEACCHWIEEHQPSDACESNAELERTILFDEDRFFQIKNLRAMGKFEPLFADSPGVGEFALKLEDFDLVLECFLRSQSMSSYISSRPKTSIAFS